MGLIAFARWAWNYLRPDGNKLLAFKKLRCHPLSILVPLWAAKGQTIINYVLPVRWWYLSLIYSVFMCIKRVLFVMWRWSFADVQFVMGFKKSNFLTFFHHLRSNMNNITNREGKKVFAMNQSLITRIIKKFHHVQHAIKAQL